VTAPVTKPVAKSLHTVTVLMQVARRIRGDGETNEQAIASAMAVLGLAGRPDPYGLAAAALKQMAAG
jgi:hypothetical protein